jgi:hypothetical protein
MMVGGLDACVEVNVDRRLQDCRTVEINRKVEEPVGTEQLAQACKYAVRIAIIEIHTTRYIQLPKTRGKLCQGIENLF